MERYSSRKVDEQGRIVLHEELRKKLGLAKGDKLFLIVIDSIIVLKQADTGECEICELGMIKLPADIREKFAWVVGSEIAVYHTDSLIILKTA